MSLLIAILSLTASDREQIPPIITPVDQTASLAKITPPHILALKRKTLTCAGQLIRPLIAQDPNPAILRSYIAKRFFKKSSAIKTLEVSFDVNSAGKPINIQPQSKQKNGHSHFQYLKDTIPAIAT